MASPGRRQGSNDTPQGHNSFVAVSFDSFAARAAPLKIKALKANPMTRIMFYPFIYVLTKQELVDQCSPWGVQ